MMRVIHDVTVHQLYSPTIRTPRSLMRIVT